MKTILIIGATHWDNAEDIRTLRDWISEFTTLKMRFEPHRGRITTEHVEVIFITAWIQEKMLGFHLDAICSFTYIDPAVMASFEARKPDLKDLPGIEGVLREIIELEEAATNEEKERGENSNEQRPGKVN